MSYQTSDKHDLILFANLSIPEEEHNRLLEISRNRINLELLKRLDTDNLIDYSKYENNLK